MSITSPVSTDRIKTTPILELSPCFCQVPYTVTATFATCLLFILTIFSGLLISANLSSYWLLHSKLSLAVIDLELNVFTMLLYTFTVTGGGRSNIPATFVIPAKPVP